MKRTLALALLVLPLVVGASLEAGAQGAAPSAVPARPHLPDADGAPQGDVPVQAYRTPSIGRPHLAEIEKRSGEHDGVTVLGGEPFDQIESLEILVKKLKTKSFHLTIYTGYTLEYLLAHKVERVSRILAETDLLIDGAFKRDLTANVGEYRGSSNQRLIFYPMRRRKDE